MQFNVYKFGLPAEDMDVIATDYSKKNTSWLFKPVYDVPLLGNYGDYAHPLAGYRQFGIVSDVNNQTFTFFTRGVDRPYGVLSAGISSTIFKGANKLWNAVMTNVAFFVNSMGRSNGREFIKQTNKLVERCFRGRQEKTNFKWQLRILAGRYY